MLYHAEQHLLQQGDTVAGVWLEQNESISFSHKNLISLCWIKAIHPQLLSIVKLEKHKELKSGTQLHVLVPDISKNIDEWLKRNNKSLPSRIQEKDSSESPDPNVRNLRFNSQDRQLPRDTSNGFRGRGGFRGGYSRSNNRFPSSRTNAGPNKFCPGCNYLAKELSLDVNFRHHPADCPRKKSVLRLLYIEEQELDVQHEDDQEPVEEDGHAQDIEEGNEGLEQYDKHIESSENAKCNVKAIWKAQSPSVRMFYSGFPLLAVIDEGSEVSAIDLDVSEAMNISLSRTLEEAQAAGSLPLKVVGKTNKDIIVYRVLEDHKKVYWNLGQCIVVQNLGCDLLIGEPAKAINNINTNPMSKTITTSDVNMKKAVLSYENEKSMYFSESSKDNDKQLKPGKTTLNKVTKAHTVYPNTSVYVPVPSQIKSCKDILVECAENLKFPGPGIRQVRNGNVCIHNYVSSSKIRR